MRRPRVLAIPLSAALLLAAVGSHATAQEIDPQTAPATQLRVALDRVLAEHAFLIVDAMRLGVAGGPEFEAAADALDQNGDDLIGAIAEVYGPDAGEAFGEQWRNHHAYLIDYARALAEDDAAAAELADQQLRAYIVDFASLTSGAISPLPEDAVAGLVREHVLQLQQIAAFDAADFGDAYPTLRATYEHMFAIGDGLALGIVNQFPQRFTGGVHAFSPAIDMRLSLDRLLGEHTELASLAMRASLTDAPDLASAVDALNANTTTLAETIASIYGDEAGVAFAVQWNTHTGLYVDYVAAIKAGDDAAADTAREGLAEYSTDFTAFLASANPFLSETAFRGLVGDHTDHLLAQVDAYAAGDFANAYEIGRDGFAHAGVLSAGLAEAIADQFPLLFPDTALARQPRAPTGVALLALAGLAGLAAGTLAWRLSRRRG